MKKHIDTRSNKGFTLVELLVALLISGILLGTVSSVFFMSQKLYTRGADISYKEGSITNTETNLQNYLSIATAVTLASTPPPTTDDKKSYSIGFKNDGTCEEVTMIQNVDGAGNPILVGGKKCTQSVSTLSQISEIQVGAVGTNVATLNYDLIPFNSMSTLSGGIVMNNIKLVNSNMPSDELKAGTNLNASTNGMHYLVLTFEEISGSGSAPGIDEILKDLGVISGNWDKMIAKAKVSYGYLLSPNGAVYTDDTGTYVTGDLQYISESFAKTDPPAATYYSNTGGAASQVFIKISETSRFITDADYETNATRIQNGFIWKDGQRPRLGDLYEYNNEIYIWQRSSTYEMPKNPKTDVNWLKLVSSPVEFQ